MSKRARSACSVHMCVCIAEAAHAAEQKDTFSTKAQQTNIKTHLLQSFESQRVFVCQPGGPCTAAV